MMKNLNWVQTIDLNLLTCGSGDRFTKVIVNRKSKITDGKLEAKLFLIQATREKKEI